MTNETNDQQTLEEKLREQEKDLVLKCGECHEKAMWIKDDKKDFLSEKEYDLFGSSLRYYYLSRKLNGKLFEELINLFLFEKKDPSKIDDFLTKNKLGGLDNYCPDCDKVYCYEHYRIRVERQANPWYNYYAGTCHKGHKKVVDYP